MHTRKLFLISLSFSFYNSSKTAKKAPKVPSKKKKQRLKKQKRAKQVSQNSTSTTTGTITKRGSVASMAIVMICSLALLLGVLTQLGSVNVGSFPWIGILLLLSGERFTESNQV